METTKFQTVECRQEDLAYILGLPRVSIGKALKGLQQVGLIELHYGKIVMSDVALLTKWAKDKDQVTPV